MYRRPFSQLLRWRLSEPCRNKTLHFGVGATPAAKRPPARRNNLRSGKKGPAGSSRWKQSRREKTSIQLSAGFIVSSRMYSQLPDVPLAVQPVVHIGQAATLEASCAIKPHVVRNCLSMRNFVGVLKRGFEALLEMKGHIV